MAGKKKHPLLVKVKHGGKLAQWVLDALRDKSNKTGISKDAMIHDAVVNQCGFKEPDVE